MRLQKVIVAVGIAWLFVVTGSSTLVYGQAASLTGSSQESSFRLGRDLSLTVGLDVWPNQWVKSVSAFPSGGSNIGQVSAFGVAFIPNATLTYQRFFLSTSYMVTPDYHFGKITSLQSINPNGTADPTTAALFEISSTASRQEGDLTIGYFPLDWLGVAIGYKGIFQDFDNKFRLIAPVFPSPPFPPGLNNEMSAPTQKVKFNGLTLGALASVQIDDRFSLIGNAFGGYLFISCSPSNRCIPGQPNALYTSSKLVLRYAPTPQISMTLGYRVQVINIQQDFAPNGIDLTHGPIIGVNYRF